MSNKRFIEESFPVKEVSEESVRERNISQGHISTLHIWWARKPLASSRASEFAALVPSPKDEDELRETRQFIVDYSKWQNSLKPGFIEAARKKIIAANDGVPPKVLDPFAGGGSLALESLRLGCETYASDLNPVAVLLEKATLEYPQKFGRHNTSTTLGGPQKSNSFAEEIERWGEWVLVETRREIERFFPADADGSTAVGFYWMRTIPCQNPSCQSVVPLTTNWWLAKKHNKRVSLYPYVEDKQLKFKIVGDGYVEMPIEFDPDRGTVSRAITKCLVCGSMTDAATTRKKFQDGAASQMMVAVILHKPGTSGKRYRAATRRDFEIFEEAETYLKNERKDLAQTLGFDPVPDEDIPLMSGTFNVPLYGIQVWGDLFNSRQKLALIIFVEKVREAYRNIVALTKDDEYAKAIATYLALGVDRLADRNSVLCGWENTTEKIGHTFGRQALGMLWDYFEANPFSNSTGNWKLSIRYVSHVVEHLSQISSSAASVTQSSATSLPYQDNYFDAIFTDPPYYNVVPYADLSDFFYVWLKRAIGDLYPDLFATRLTPKSEEIAELSGWDSIRYSHKDKHFFESKLKKTFQEVFRVLKPNGIALVVYAHKSLEGWESLINSLLDSGLVVTGAWPLSTENVVRLRAKESATLASTIYIVARKIERLPVGFNNEVREELKKHLNQKLDRLWREGISGADFFIAAIGSAIEVFGKYEKVMDYEGNVIRADKLLDDVQHIATDYAVKQILHDGLGATISNLTRFYVLWRWNYADSKVHFDEARKLAQSCDIDLSREWGKNGFIKKEKEFVRVLGPQVRRLESLKDSSELIDVLHYILLLWEQSKQNEIVEALSERGYSQSEALRRVSQAVAQTLPNESKEKKLLEGFLPSWGRLRQEIKEASGQMKLSEY